MELKFKPIGYVSTEAFELFNDGTVNAILLYKESFVIERRDPNLKRYIPVYKSKIYAANPWKEAILESMCKYGLDTASEEESPESILNRLIETAIAIEKDPAVNKDRNVVAYSLESNGRVEYYFAPYLQAKINFDLSKYTPVYTYENNMFPIHINEYIVRYSEEVFVVFNPKTDGSEILGACRTINEAYRILNFSEKL